MAVTDFEDTSAAATALAAWQASPAVAAALGGTGRVRGIPDAPWPCLVITPGFGGSLGDLIHATTREVVLEAYDHPAGPVGDAQLERILLTALRAGRAWLDTPQPAGAAVIVGFTPGSAPSPSPLVTGQRRWRCTAYVTIHPAQDT